MFSGYVFMDRIEILENKQIEQMLEDKEIPKFRAGDNVSVKVLVREGARERFQVFEGVCIACSGKGLNKNFTVRKISYGEGVERVFPLYSPMVESIDVVRKGKVKRSKLYYLRNRRGKSARIAERQSSTEKKDNVSKKAESESDLPIEKDNNNEV